MTKTIEEKRAGVSKYMVFIDSLTVNASYLENYEVGKKFTKDNRIYEIIKIQKNDYFDTEYFFAKDITVNNNLPF